MIIVEQDSHYFVLSTDDKIFDTLKKSVPNAKIVNISNSEYDQVRDNIPDLEELISSKLKEDTK